MTESKTLQLPRLVAGADFAAEMVAALIRRDGAVYGATVIVDGSALLHGTASFARELVRLLAVDGGAAIVVVADAPPEFVQDVAHAAEALGVVTGLEFVASAAVASS